MAAYTELGVCTCDPAAKTWERSVSLPSVNFSVQNDGKLPNHLQTTACLHNKHDENEWSSSGCSQFVDVN
jgi:hypothetical protein